MLIGRTRARKTSEVRQIYRVRTFCLVKKKKSLDLKISSQTEKNEEAMVHSK